MKCMAQGKGFEVNSHALAFNEPEGRKCRKWKVGARWAVSDDAGIIV